MPENTNHTGSSGSSSRIRTRSSARNVNVIDKASNLAERTKSVAIRTKRSAQSVLDENYENETSYAQDRSGEGARQVAHDTKEAVRRTRQKVRDETRKQIEKRLEKNDTRSSRSVEQGRVRTRDQARIRDIKTREAARQGNGSIKTTAKSSGKATVKGTERTIKTAQHTSKTAVKTTKAAAKATKESAQAAAKASEKAAVAAKNAAAAAGRAAAAAAKAIAAAAKAIAASLWKLAMAAGAALVAAAPFIALGCVILAVAVLCTGDTRHDMSATDTSSVIQEINQEWQKQITEITSKFEDVTMEGGRATWPQIFSLYTAMSSQTSVDTWDEKRDLRQLFWDMNWVSYDIYTVVEAEKVPEVDVKILMRSVDVKFLCGGEGSVLPMETETYLNDEKPEAIAKKYPDRKMHAAIVVTTHHYSVEEMADKRGFTKYQMEQAEALLEKEFASFWQERIYGVVGANDDIVNVAITQLGNSGGWPYWEYCGWPSRVEWCACFITWCGDQCGYVKAGLLPMTSSPWVQMEFFKEKGQWVAGGTEPSPGMIVFYDYYGNGLPDHVGIIEKVEKGTVYSIEGNWGDSVQRVTRVLGDPEVMGYGWIVEK